MTAKNRELIYQLDDLLRERCGINPTERTLQKLAAFVEIAQREAWNAARVTKSYHMVDNEEYAVHGSILKYRTFEQWNEANK